MKTKLTPDQVDSVRRRVCAGERPSDIAREFSITKSAVSQIVRFHTHHKGAVIPATVSKATRLRLELLALKRGTTTAAIAGELLEAAVTEANARG